MKVRFFNPGLGYQKIREEVLSEVDRVLTAGDLILRDDVEKFEKTLAEYVGTKYAVSLNSGTDALYLALKAFGIGPGDDVLVPSHTFVATAQVVAQCGANPVLFDMDQILHFTENTKAVIVAHIAGEIEAKMSMVVQICNDQGIAVIEDACQSLGAVQEERMAGSFGLAGAFSFYPAKILGAYGDAGALVTNDPVIYAYVKEARNHFKTDYSEWGINSRLDNIQAAILNIKFKDHVANLIRRQAIANQYLNRLSVDILPKNTKGRVWQDFVIKVEKRDELYEFLKENGIESMKNEYFFPIVKGPLSVDYEAHTLRIPCNPDLTDEEVNYVIETINSFSM